MKKTDRELIRKIKKRRNSGPIMGNHVNLPPLTTARMYEDDKNAMQKLIESNAAFLGALKREKREA